jgi:CubicO group peptidase (beta-lactamase class C family)
MRSALAVALLATSVYAQIPNLDQTVERALKQFNVPGTSVAVVKDGKVVLTKGYGVRKLGESARVDENTLFGIASNTKAFTAASLALLVDEGKLNWDDPVIQHYPAFQMYDMYATHNMTVRDLISHRSGLGLGAGDLLIFPDGLVSSEEILRRLRYIKPNKSFRDHYDYSNLMFLVAGKVIENVSGKTWHQFVRERIYAPLQMTTSTTSSTDLKPGMNFANPHAEADGVLKPVPLTALENCAPAGSLNSSAAEMTRWVITQLNRGVAPDGKRLFSEARSRDMWSAVTPIPAGEPPKNLPMLRSNFRAYGLGWSLRDYRGRKMVTHDGGLAGMVTRVILIPEENLGVVVLTNAEEGSILNAIGYTILDHYLGGTTVDWVQTFDDLRKEGLQRAKEAVSKVATVRNANSKPSLPLTQYAGTYRDPWYGDVKLIEDGARLRMEFTNSPTLIGYLEHFQYDTFIVRWKDRSLNADAYVTFALTPEGKIDQVKMKAVSALTDFSYDFHDLDLHRVEPKRSN